MDEVERQVVLISDVTGDLGVQLVGAALRAGAVRVYACAPRALASPSPRVIPVVLDVADPESVRSLAARATDVTAIVTTSTSENWPPVSVSGGDVAALERHFVRTVTGPLRLVTSLAPVLAANGGGVIACVESVQAWINLTGAYAVAQSALWSAVNALRVELRASGVHVLAAVGAFDEAEHLSLRDAADDIMAGIRDRVNEIILDEYTAGVRRLLSAPLEQVYPELNG